MSSAGRMKKSAYRLCFCEFVVERDCFLGRQDVRGDLTFLQKIQRLARHVKAFGHSARKHDYSGAMIQQFLHITDLNSSSIRAHRLGKALRPCKACLFPGFQVGPRKRVRSEVNVLSVSQ